MQQPDVALVPTGTISRTIQLVPRITPDSAPGPDGTWPKHPHPPHSRPAKASRPGLLRSARLHIPGEGRLGRDGGSLCHHPWQADQGQAEWP